MGQGMFGRRQERSMGDCTCVRIGPGKGVLRLIYGSRRVGL